MKKKKILLVLSLLMVFTLTGCTKNLTNAENKQVKNELTGQNLVANILCQPEDEETIKVYNDTRNNTIESLNKKLENKEITQKDYDKKMDSLVNIEDLPKCSEFTPASGGYEGIWTTIFVKPLAWLILELGELVKNYGISVILITILIRSIMIPITKKTAVQSENMKNAKPELDRLEKKYQNKTDQNSVMQKSQEMMLIYKKYEISPFSGCLYALLQIPLFFAFFEALNRLPAIFEETLLGFQLGTSPLTAFGKGQYYYVIIIALVIFTTVYSFKLNSTASIDDSMQQQMKTMMTISIVMISIMSFTISTGIALYWIFNSAFTIVQNLVVKRRNNNVKYS